MSAPAFGKQVPENKLLTQWPPLSAAFVLAFVIGPGKLCLPAAVVVYKGPSPCVVTFDHLAPIVTLFRMEPAGILVKW